MTTTTNPTIKWRPNPFGGFYVTVTDPDGTEHTTYKLTHWGARRVALRQARRRRRMARKVQKLNAKWGGPS